MDAIGHSRYLPIVLYEKGGPEHAAYIGNKMEGGEHQNHPFWTPTLHAACWGTLDAANLSAPPTPAQAAALAAIHKATFEFKPAESIAQLDAVLTPLR